MLASVSQRVKPGQQPGPALAMSREPSVSVDQHPSVTAAAAAALKVKTMPAQDDKMYAHAPWLIHFTGPVAAHRQIL
jgi:hypothetical protein